MWGGFQVDPFEHPVVIPHRSRLEKIVNRLRIDLNMLLFGADVIVENETGDYHVIDVNPFPSKFYSA